MIKQYYNLTKPGIIYGNALPAIAAFLFACKWHIHWVLFLAMIIGLSLVIGSACVFNNIFDADIDLKMARTKNRAIAIGAISKSSAKIYGSVLLILGGLVLSFTNNLTLIVALIGWVFYVLIYTPLKRITVHDTLIGSVAGATPPVVGYVAVTNKLDISAIILFFILVFWQMPHFYAIAIRRIKDYQEAKVPVLPIKMGIQNTKIQMLIYCFGFLVSCLSLTYFRAAGYTYAAVALILGLIWIIQSLQGFKATDNTAWAKKMFLSSLLILTTLSVILSLGKILP